ERSIDEKGIWICCDQCGSWVKAEDDGISDISVYDDSNPNHLDYFCPPCRAKNAKKPRGSSKGSSKKPSASALKRMAAAEQAQRPSAPSKIRRPAAGSSSSKRSSARIDDAEDDDSDDLSPSPSEALERHEKLLNQLIKSYNID
ncbi:MAG: hypothetical protein Q8P67_22045, partial [archaeon]|nr:hypothetical protein [archaeon]